MTQKSIKWWTEKHKDVNEELVKTDNVQWRPIKTKRISDDELIKTTNIHKYPAMTNETKHRTHPVTNKTVQKPSTIKQIGLSRLSNEDARQFRVKYTELISRHINESREHAPINCLERKKIAASSKGKTVSWQWQTKIWELRPTE